MWHTGPPLIYALFVRGGPRPKVQIGWLSKSYVAEASRGKSQLLHFSGLTLPLAQSPLRSLPSLAGHLVSPTKVRTLAVSIKKRNLDFLRIEDFGK